MWQQKPTRMNNGCYNGRNKNHKKNSKMIIEKFLKYTIVKSQKDNFY